MDNFPDSVIPLRSRDSSSQLYLEQVLVSYRVSLVNSCYDNAFLNAYLLLIYWLYVKLWFMAKTEPERIRDLFILHSFDSKFDESEFLSSERPGLLSELKLEERRYSKIFKRLCLDEDLSKKLRKLTDDRNSIAHPTGVILCPDESSLNDQLQIMYELTTEIATWFSHKYLEYYTSKFGRLGLRKLRNWENYFELEQNLFASLQISELDLTAIIKTKSRGI